MTLGMGPNMEECGFSAVTHSYLAGLMLAIGWLAACPVMAAPPANDQFANRIVLLGGARVTTTGTIMEATREPNEPGEGTAYAPPRLHSVWWSWTAPSDGLLVVSVIGSDFPALVEVFTGAALQELTSVSTCRAYAGRCETARVQVSAGTAYQIAVDGNLEVANPVAGGGILLNLAHFVRPPNDDFAARIHLGSGDVSVTGTNTAATWEPDENRSWFSGFGRSMRWAWTAAVSGPVTMGVEAGAFDPEARVFGEFPDGETSVAVFVGDALGTATLLTNRVGQGFRWVPDLAQVAFNAVAGTSYQIAVDGRSDMFNALTLRIARTPDCRASSFSSAQRRSRKRSTDQAGAAALLRLLESLHTSLPAPDRRLGQPSPARRMNQDRIASAAR